MGNVSNLLTEIANGAPWSYLPPPTCDALDALLEKAPELSAEIEAIRNDNSQLRYGYSAAHAIMRDWRDKARAALPANEKETD